MSPPLQLEGTLKGHLLHSYASSSNVCLTSAPIQRSRNPIPPVPGLHSWPDSLSFPQGTGRGGEDQKVEKAVLAAIGGDLGTSGGAWTQVSAPTPTPRGEQVATQARLGFKLVTQAGAARQLHGPQREPSLPATPRWNLRSWEFKKQRTESRKEGPLGIMPLLCSERNRGPESGVAHLEGHSGSRGIVGPGKRGMPDPHRCQLNPSTPSFSTAGKVGAPGWKGVRLPLWLSSISHPGGEQASAPCWASPLLPD